MENVDHGDGLKIEKYPWYLLPVHLLASTAFLSVRIPMVVLGLLACAIGVFSVPNPAKQDVSYFPRWLWLWDSRVSTIPEPWWWEGRNHWSHKLGFRFTVWWWRAIRNPASNFTRYALQGDDWYDISTTEGSLRANMKPRWSGETTYWQVRWNRRKWWLSEFYFCHVWGKSYYFIFRYGFKLGRVFSGLGFTSRLNPWQKHDGIRA
jgi:hypothetical protein